MTEKILVTRSLKVLISFVFISSQVSLAQQSDLAETNSPQANDRLALLGDFNSNSPTATAAGNEPVPFSISAMAGDLVPPFAAHPDLQPVRPSDDDEISFEENMPVETSELESIDDCCRELTEMIAGNLDSDISIAAKKRMIETALKMVARNVALKAEAEATKLKADHTLEMARMQGQMLQMRSMGSAADQINRVAGPLSQVLQQNYQQAVAMNEGNQKLSQTLAQLGYQRLEEKAEVARANRQRIQLTSPSPEETARSRRVEQLNEQLARLQQELRGEYGQGFEDLDTNVPETANAEVAGWYQVHPKNSNTIRPVTYSQPLQPRRQPLEPMPERQANRYFNNNASPQPAQWRR